MTSADTWVLSRPFGSDVVFVTRHWRVVLELLDLADPHSELGIVHQGVEVRHHQHGVFLSQFPIGSLPLQITSTLSLGNLLMGYAHNSIRKFMSVLSENEAVEICSKLLELFLLIFRAVVYSCEHLVKLNPLNTLS